MANKSYATLTQFKSSGWLNITPTDAARDTAILRLLQDASIEIDKFCRRSFQVKAETRTFDGSGQTLMLDDLLAVTTFLLDDSGAQTYSTTLTTDDYGLYPLNQFPKTYAKISHISNVGGFAGGIRAGVKITGNWGHGDGESATPYAATGATANGSINTSATAFNASDGSLLERGHTLLIDSEQVYVSNVSTNAVTVVRAVNGTTAANHSNAATLSVYQYPGPIVTATLIQASRWWKRRTSAFETGTGAPEIGQILVYKGLDPDVSLAVEPYIKRTLF